MNLTFFGAARQVTGSQFLLEEDDYRILIDCGTDLNPKKDAPTLGNFNFDPSTINLVVLTHAHIDHSGQIPNLFLEGFEGQIICTSPTLELAELLLNDSASLNARKLKSIQNRKKNSRKRVEEKSKGLYLKRQVSEALDNFVPIAFNKPFKFKDNAKLTLYPAGHLLGAAHVFFEFIIDGQTKTIAFSGDIGRKDYPLLDNPFPLPQADYLVCETTYGQREHKTKEPAEEVLYSIIKEACYDKPGRLVIPSFSVGRSQALLYTLNKIYRYRNLNPIKIFTDSPLAKASTKVYEKYHTLLNSESKAFIKEEYSLFDFENLVFVGSTNESKEISGHTEACIIISSSGMIKGGRIERHIAENIENPYATILMIGYSVPGTMGYTLANEDPDFIEIRNDRKEVNAKLISTDVFSGHGDLNDLIEFTENQDPKLTKGIFLVHGEEESMFNFKEILNNKGYKNIAIPNKNETFQL